MKGLTIEELMSSFINRHEAELVNFLLEKGYIICPECERWFLKKDYDCSSSDEGCFCHTKPCNRIFSVDRIFYVCEEDSSDMGHAHIDNNGMKCRRLIRGDICEVDANGVLRLKTE